METQNSNTFQKNHQKLYTLRNKIQPTPLFHISIPLLYTIHNHSIYNIHMPIRIRITHLTLIIQPIRPKVTPPTRNRSICPIKRLQQRQRRRPIIRITMLRKRRRRAHTKRVRNLMQRRPFCHVRPVAAKADIAVAAAVGGGHACVVFDGDGFGGFGTLGVVSRDGGVHGGGYLGVGVVFVVGGAGGFCDGVGELGRGEAGGCCREEEGGKVHVCLRWLGCKVFWQQVEARSGQIKKKCLFKI